MRHPHKIKAGALQFVLFIGAIVAILLLSFVLISYTHSLFGKKTDVIVDLVQEAEYGLQYAYQKDIGVGEVFEIPSKDHKGISVSVEKKYWGVFEKYRAKAEHGKRSFTKLAFSGNHVPQGLPALYLKDKQRPLVIAGNAKITGEVYRPKQGIRMGNIAGNSYRHDRLVYGKEHLSTSFLPKLNTAMSGEIDKVRNSGVINASTIRLSPNMELKNSFHDPTVFLQENSMALEGVSLSGNMMIIASRKIVVYPTAHLRDVVLVAPEIIIRDGVRGYFQAIASERIAVGSRCELAYPSALVVKQKKIPNTQSGYQDPNISIDGTSVVNGMVVYLDPSDTQSHRPQIKVAENAVVRGQLYCTGNLELQGAVIGNVTTNAFIALENGSIYQNHLYQGHIDATKLPLEYAGLPMDGGTRKKTIKWLY